MTKKEEALARKAAKLEAEKKRIQDMKIYEQRAIGQLSKMQGDGRTFLICGIDEAGRGPFAGPVVAGAVILDLEDPEKEILYLNDSKKLSEKKREMLYREILGKAIAVGIGYAGPHLIDRINILQATFHAMRMAIGHLRPVSHLVEPDLDVHELVRRLIRYEIPKKDGEADASCPGEPVVPDHILADAVHIPDIPISQEGIVKGDAKSVSIAAGSIVAKVTRDHIMYEYDRQYPDYGFASHKGYGTRAHIEAIRNLGMTDIHRRSFIHLSEKTDNRKLGNSYEDLACEYLENKGFQILTRNYRVKIGEIDIIARDKEELVFVEVKYRAGQEHGGADYAITQEKQQTIRRVAEWYMKQYHIPGDTFCRFDAVLINGSDIRHVPKAW